MSLDPRFVLCPSLQEQFWDKDLNVPLSAGVVTFYQDDSRTTLKTVYTINGNGPYSDTSYVPLPNPIILSAIGTFVDNNGNDIIPYLFPYDGNYLTTTNKVELYYITVYSAQGVFQFSREAWPNTTAQVVNVNEVTNFIPNGQFLLHNNSPVVESNVTVPALGGTSADVSLIAQGGWTFEINHGGTPSVNTVSFSTNVPSSNPDTTGDPRFSLNVACTSPSGTDTIKDICIAFPDVNKFASNATDPNYTFSFQAINLGTNVNVGVRLIKYFGSSGASGPTPSPSTDVPFGVGTASINNSSLPVIYNTAGLFGNNDSSTLGSNNDDYLQIAIRFPVGQTFNVTLSDFVLTNGNVVLTGFPITTNAEFLAPSTAGSLPTPNPDGSDLYLPIKLGPNGFLFDHSEVGDITAKTSIASFTNSISTISNELACDGTQFAFTGYSPLGIPYSRLANTIFDSTSGCYRWGSGGNWINTYISTGSTAQMMLVTNKVNAAQTAPADSAGGTATGFTFVANNNTGTAGFNYEAYSNSTGFVTVISNFTNGTHSGNGVVDGSAGNATTMTLANYNNPSIAVGYYAFTIQAKAASVLANTGSSGKYFTFSDHGTDYYMWFFVSNETDPAPGGTGIKCQLTSTMSAADVGAIIAATIFGYQSNFITVTGQPSGGAGSYFTFNSNSVQSAVWYQVAGVGAAPAISSKVMVALTGAENAASVASKTQQAINKAFFATPNFQGLTLRGQDTNGIWDADVANRFALNAMMTAGSIGTLELSQITSHLHGATSTPTGTVTIHTGFAGGGANFITFGAGNNDQNQTDALSLSTTTTIAMTGGSESRPVNEFVFYAIKY